ncbi:hypothetical protein ACHAXT_011010 [Thalassiosira profunda]
MGKKRSAHRSSARGSAASTSNAGSSSMGSSSGSVPSHLMGQTFSHPTGVPLRQGSFASSTGGGGAGSSAGAGGSGLDGLSRQLASLSPAMLRELLAASGGLGDMGYNDGGYDDDLPPDMGSAPYAASSGISGGMMSGSFSGSGTIDMGNMGNLSPEDAAQAQRYLQSIGQALTAQLSASGNNPPASSNGKVFGPPPPPPTGAPAGSATFSTGSMTLDLNSATGQGLTSQLEALSQLMMAQKDHANSILRNGHAAVDRSNVSEARKAEALEALDKLGESTRDHVANFQSLMGYMSSQGGAGGSTGTLPAYSSASASAGSSASVPPNSSASHYTNTSTNFGPSDVDPSALPLFHELVRLTHSIAAAQESGDATAADDATNRLCEAVMRDPASMGALGAALSNPTGVAGMTALFQGMAVGAGASGGPASMNASGAGARGGRGLQQSFAASSGAAVPPLPPPAGGFPPSSGPAAAAAAMAAFAGAGPPPPAADARDEAGAQAWLDYYDACLRAGGVAGGLREFEERARTGPGVSRGSGSMRGDLPQDRPVDCPAEFEYDDGAAPTTEEAHPTAEELQQLAEEEEARLKKKAERKREKKARQKERQRREAEAKAAAAAAKKRERAVAAWRSRAVQACLAGDARKMEVLAGESPYKNYTHDLSSGVGDDEGEERPRSRAEYLARELGWFLPRCLQKYPPRASHSSGAPCAANPAREALAKYVMATSFDAVLLQSSLKRNALHSAAYHNDADFLSWVAEASKNPDDSSEERRSGKNYLEEHCHDAGWTPLHYAVAGGSAAALEILLAAGADARQTTLRGATARDLAAMLQNGGSRGECACDADMVDEIVEARIHKASEAERAGYVQLLEAMGERLGDVADNGYSPPKEAPPRQEASEREAGGEQSTTAATSKKSKKKKKQPPANASKSASSASESKSATALAPVGDGDLSDPVAVALLGMGFAPDQIRAAARALGGFDRAAADDMVVWILGSQGGEGEGAEGSQGAAAEGAEVPTAPHPDRAPDADHQREGAVDAEVLSKAQKKAAAKAQRAAEERAKQQRDARAAEERAAAKREERRRIRREWNEKESARQAEEKRAKAAEAMERRRRAEMEKLLPPGGMVPGAMGGSAPPISAVHVPPAGMHHRHPPGHPPGHGGGPPLTIIAGGPKPTRPKPGSHMGIPPAPAVRAPKILARPSHAPPHPAAGSQPLFAPAVPTVVRAGSSSPPRVSANARPYRPAGHRHPQPTAILQKGGGMAAPHHPQVLSRGHAPADYYRQPGQPASGYGGGTHPHHPGPSHAAPPAASANAPTAEANPMGTIRATAREFVPAGFSSMNSTAQEFVPSLSAQTAAVPPLSSAPPPPAGGSASHDPSANDAVEPMAALLHSLGGDGPAPPATSVPMKEHDSTVPSAASSITGLSGLPSGTGEDPTSRVGSALTFESTSSAMQTTSILESIACGEDAPGSSVGLWGGANTVNQGSSSLGLAGLNFSSFMGEQGKGGGAGNAGGAGTWGANTGGGGSIW